MWVTAVCAGEFTPKGVCGGSGLPPRARGRRSRRLRRRYVSKVYPRARGADTVNRPRTLFRQGLPPHTRGCLRPAQVAAGVIGLNPAYAGLVPDLGGSSACGSPPGARGSLPGLSVHERSWRFRSRPGAGTPFQAPRPQHPMSQSGTAAAVVRSPPGQPAVTAPAPMRINIGTVPGWAPYSSDHCAPRTSLFIIVSSSPFECFRPGVNRRQMSGGAFAGSRYRHPCRRWIRRLWTMITRGSYRSAHASSHSGSASG